MMTIPVMTFFPASGPQRGWNRERQLGSRASFPSCCHFLKTYCAPSPVPVPVDPWINQTEPGLVGHTVPCGRQTRHARTSCAE